MLEALLNQSANDVAYSLAAWDAGSEAAFVAKMNTLAASLGATHSHYVDASGYQPQSVSTAADTLRIAAAGMAIPTFASVAGMTTVSLPMVGTVHNLVTEIGSDGIIGVKSGYTAQSAGCMVLAGYRTVYGRSVLVLASVLGQLEPQPAPPAAPAAPAAGSPTTAPSTTAPTPTSTTTTVPYSALEAQYPLRYAGPLVQKLLDASRAAVVPMVLTTKGATLGTATADWGGEHHQMSAVTIGGAWLLGVPGQRVSVRTTGGGPSTGSGTGPIGAVAFTLGTQRQIVPLRLDHTVAQPTWWWKLTHG